MFTENIGGAPSYEIRFSVTHRSPAWLMRRIRKSSAAGLTQNGVAPFAFTA